MPIHTATLPNGGVGFQWGKHGKIYASRKDAERQATAAFANGYTEDDEVDAEDSYAFDESSVRATDPDGRMHVSMTNISKANVCPYNGNEIPNYEALGLEADKVYKLFRDPEELERAVPTFNNIPLLIKHVSVTADDHQPNLVVGSTGTDAQFEAPFLRNSLVVWAKKGITAIESNKQKELSSAYRYEADMTPGIYNGEQYDGVMRNIIGNHVALVEEGRAGHDVVVGDSKHLEYKAMSTLQSRKASIVHGALLVYMKPLLAQDAKIDIASALKGVDSNNYSEKKASIVAAIKTMTNGKLAKDASISDLNDLLDGLEKIKPLESIAKDEVMVNDGGEGGSVEAGHSEEKKMTMDKKSGLKNFLKGKLSEDDMKACDEWMDDDKEEKKDDKKEEKAEDIGVEEKDDKKEDDEKDSPKEDKGTSGNVGAKDKKFVTKGAMDAAVAAAVQEANAKAAQNQRETREAENEVRPYIGNVAIACDSAENVYRTTFKALNIDVSKVKDVEALKVMLKILPKPNSIAPVSPSIGMDSASSKSFNDMFPDAARIKVI